MSPDCPIIGRQITIHIDRPLGSTHPNYPGLRYPVNYGYVPGVLGGDGDAQDVYLLGVSHPVSSYDAVVIAIIHRHDDVETKWVAAPVGLSVSLEEIRRLTAFQERYFQSEIEL